MPGSPACSSVSIPEGISGWRIERCREKREAVFSGIATRQKSAGQLALTREVAFDDRADLGLPVGECAQRPGALDRQQPAPDIADMDTDALALAAAGDAARHDTGVIDGRAVVEMAGAFVVDKRFAVPVDVVEVSLHVRLG